MALTLGRKEGERILIGDDVVIEVVRARGGKARIAIFAPVEVNVVREELLPEREERSRG